MKRDRYNMRFKLFLIFYILICYFFFEPILDFLVKMDVGYYLVLYSTDPTSLLEPICISLLIFLNYKDIRFYIQRLYIANIIFSLYFSKTPNSFALFYWFCLYKITKIKQNKFYFKYLEILNFLNIRILLKSDYDAYNFIIVDEYFDDVKENFDEFSDNYI